MVWKYGGGEKEKKWKGYRRDSLNGQLKWIKEHKGIWKRQK